MEAAVTVWPEEAELSENSRLLTKLCFSPRLPLQILVWHTRTEKPVLVNEGKKGFTDPNVEI